MKIPHPIPWSFLSYAVERGGEALGDLLSPPTCPACSAVLGARAVFCADCARLVVARPTWQDGVFTAVEWGGPVKEAIVRLKYGRDPSAGRPLGHLLRAALATTSLAVDAVMPVPLHPRRLVERGFNQCTLLARAVARQLDVPLESSRLRRVIATSPQAGKSGAERRAGLEGAFVARGVRGRAVALVDDVVTTGSTLDAASRALAAAGARSVVCIALARASRQSDP